ncbi:NAD(P)-dependent alcohol dehydrogenase [Bradyrhizobium sp. WYCCWR 13023]|uniref:NAD(P)-dependent alcohol dehydrogenase n=1 Tax=Bradyrhizobium zhengyangense TaxID=2911009 RepID=A0A9X1UAD9_9BRAD|nr:MULTISPECIES: NAD(P)-dependent alcohol dehydrogenase [Bradyrhizobium]MCG2627928.1 NAD(P)-dependent alcohol dehydrogenase [Bradyrhizobium zhengyangense]MCG2642749.1 NAD(P)-dependent alcohol dehydrogenase [Bradyrhizobium zhengyangense]MCG2669643.1 NAD(P)-dependent alcohol dehydrogenase [Bradyrhizobium zhengyangense]MDA9525474.1 NADPH:quinone oxidoreductase [Bradyrhizobium sp. CCBAU 11434]
MKAYHLNSHAGAGHLVRADVSKPEPANGEVRVRVEAVSLNYRDLLILDRAGQNEVNGRVPLSDGAGIVDAIGAEVAQWKIGDRVAASFFRDWISGPFKSSYVASSLGGNATDGMLTEYVVLPASALVPVPPHLSSVEAATLPCAGVTAWHGLVTRGGLSKRGTLLVQGTGGVALFGLQFAAALGARAIVISSSDEKLARARTLGGSILINYRNTPDWDIAVMKATSGEGASHILELGGPGTYDRSLRSVASGGKIIQIGVLTGFGPKPDLARLQWENADIIGVTVGSVEHFSAMNRFLTEHAIHPIVDRIYDFEDVPEAYAHLRSGSHFGKVVVTL